MIDRCKFIHNLTCEQASMRLGELEDENAKLRELLTKAVEVAVDYYHFLGVWRDIEDIVNDMRALGIEVSHD